MTEETTEVVEAVEPEATTVPPSLTIKDLAGIVQIIDVVSERGAFKGSELESVGALRNRIADFLKANSTPDEQAEPTVAEV